MTTPDDEARRLADIRGMRAEGETHFNIGEVAFLLALVDKLREQHRLSEQVADTLQACLLDAHGRLAVASSKRLAGEVRLAKCREAMLVAHKFLAEQTGWSGSSGNWPLQDAETALRLALAATQDEGP